MEKTKKQQLKENAATGAASLAGTAAGVVVGTFVKPEEAAAQEPQENDTVVGEVVSQGQTPTENESHPVHTPDQGDAVVVEPDPEPTPEPEPEPIVVVDPEPTPEPEPDNTNVVDEEYIRPLQQGPDDNLLANNTEILPDYMNNADVDN